MIMEHIVSADRKRKENDTRRRVIGIMLNETLKWDANAKVPSDLKTIYQKMSTKGCEYCGKANSDKRCPCGNILLFEAIPDVGMKG